ncbi:hypothetical protein D9M70_573810 [compost metagenome]
MLSSAVGTWSGLGCMRSRSCCSASSPSSTAKPMNRTTNNLDLCGWKPFILESSLGRICLGRRWIFKCTAHATQDPENNLINSVRYHCHPIWLGGHLHDRAFPPGQIARFEKTWNFHVPGGVLLGCARVTRGRKTGATSGTGNIARPVPLFLQVKYFY